MFTDSFSDGPAARRPLPIDLAPPLAAAAHPFLLMLFHSLVGLPGSELSPIQILFASATLGCALAAPAIGFLVAGRPAISASMRRLAYASMLSPTLYVFLGVVQAMAGSPLPDPWVWCVLWLVATVCASRTVTEEKHDRASPAVARWRVAHGVSAAIVSLFIFFHIANHLAGLLGPASHRAVMDAGRIVYRAPLFEPALVLLLLFQVVGGLRLAWHWSAKANDAYRSFQVASGAYLSVFILGHMNSVFLYARTYLGIPTDWNFATGAPTGLLHDPWNIRLVPHYALGVSSCSPIFSPAFGLSSLRMAREQRANRIWWIGTSFSAAIAVAVIAGMCGIRL